MKIFNVLIQDRHCDAIIHNFRDKDVAIKFARANALEFCKFPDEIEETRYNPDISNGKILHIETSCEGDYVIVSEGELNEDIG